MVVLPPKNNEKGINTGKTWQPSPNGIQQERKNPFVIHEWEINTFVLTNPVLPAVGDATGLLSDKNILPDNSDRTPYNFYLQSSKEAT